MARGQNPLPIAVKGLHKSFGQQKVLEGIDLEVAKGEIVSVLGRSGTGKSVLLKLLIGLDKPDAGSIRIQGQEITALPRDKLNEVRRGMGFLFQQAALYDSMTIEQNVAFPLRRHTTTTAEEQKARVRELLTDVGMESELEKMPSDISGGMKKRVGIARALALNPDIVLFDEPTAGLDPITAVEIGDLILQLKKQRSITAIVVTHDINRAKAVSDRIVVLHEGRILLNGSFEDLHRSKDPFIGQFLRDAA
jgi:phospholipid/cholesterol/gamma-HCH transport system ATP-binding protein